MDPHNEDETPDTATARSKITVFVEIGENDDETLSYDAFSAIKDKKSIFDHVPSRRTAQRLLEVQKTRAVDEDTMIAQARDIFREEGTDDREGQIIWEAFNEAQMGDYHARPLEGWEGMSLVGTAYGYGQEAAEDDEASENSQEDSEDQQGSDSDAMELC
jgi:hypothetical protein